MSDTDVHSEVSEFSSEAVIQEQRSLDLNSYQDLPTLTADSNGIKHVVGSQDDDGGVNAGGKDVPGGSYVFVTGTDVLAADPASGDFVANSKVSTLNNGTTDQLPELDSEDAKITVSDVDEDHNCVIYGDDSITPHQNDALPGQLDMPATEVASAITVEEPSQTVIVESEPQLLVSTLKVEDPIELQSIENFHSAVAETTADLVHEKVAILSSNGGNLKSDQANGLDSIAELGQSEKCQNVVLEAAESVEVGEEKSEETDNLESTPKPEKCEAKTCQNLILKDAECELMEVEIGAVRSEEQPELKLAKEIVECPPSRDMTLESGLCQLDNKDSEAQSQLKSACEAVDSADSHITEFDGSVLHSLDNGEKNLEIKNSPDLVLDDSAGEIKDNLNSGITIAESGSYQRGNGEGIEERKKTELGIDVGGIREINSNLTFQIAVTDSVEAGPYQQDYEEQLGERKKIDSDIDLDGHEERVTNLILVHEAAKVDKETVVPLHAENAEDILSGEAKEVTKMVSSVCIDGSEKVADSQLPENAESLCSLNKCEKIAENQLPEKDENLCSLNNSVTSGRELGDLSVESAQSFPVNPSDELTAIEQDVNYKAPIIDEVRSCEVAEETVCETGAKIFEGYEERVTNLILVHEAAKVDKETVVPLHAQNAEDISSADAKEVTKMVPSVCIDGSEKVADSQLPENAESLCSLNTCEKIAENQLPEKAENLCSLSNSVTSGSELGDLSVESVQSFPVNPSDELTAIEQNVSYKAPIIDEVRSCEVAEETVCETGAKNFYVENSDSSLSCPASDINSEILVKNNQIRDVEPMSSLAKYASSETKIVFGSINTEEEVRTVDVHVESKPTNGHIKHIYGSDQNGSSCDVDPKSEVDNPRSISSRDLATAELKNRELSTINRESAPNSVVPCIVDLKIMEDQINGWHRGTDSKVIGQESENIGSMHIDDVPASLTVSGSVIEVQSAPNFDPEIVGVEANGGTSNNIIHEETNNNVEVIHGDEMPRISLPEAMEAEAVVVVRPFHFLIRVPRLEDEKLKEQIRLVKIRVEDKTRLRDNIRKEIQAKRACCQALDDAYDVAKSEEMAARKLVREKRQEIDSAASVINKVKNALSVEDIDRRVYNMEHMINHETLPLKEEKQLIREMKQLRILKEQLTSSMGSKDEVQQAMDQKDEVEERLKVLKKELDSLKAMVSKAEVKTAEAGRKCQQEFMLLRELQAHFRAADDIRQEEYKHFLSLKREAYEKNKHYWKFKDDIKESFDYASSGDLVGLHRACVNQVENFMEMWNKDEEFRKEYVRCNMRSTLRRLRTLDGRSLGPDEVAPEMPNSYVNNRNIVASERFSDSQTDRVNMMPLVQTPLEQEKQVVSHAEREVGGDGKSSSSSIEQSNDQRTAKAKKNVKPSIISRDNEIAAAVSSMGDYEEVPKEEKAEEEKSNMLQQEQIKEDQEDLAEKAAELEAKLKEQRRLEEKAKALEALERKRRNAEKAQIRAALKAQKEAEEKEKERERRLKKKERKKTGVSEGGQDEGENGHQTSEIKEAEKSSVGTAATMNSSRAPVAASSSYFRKQSKLKSIPPPPAPIIRNRNAKKRMQQLMWVVVLSIVLVTFFLFGSNSYFIILKQKKAA